MRDNITIVGDPHVTNKSIEKAKKLFKIVEEMGYPTVWLGDLLDTKEVIRGKCLNAYYDYFNTSKLEHIIIVGNHDWFNLECKDHSLKVFESLKNVTVVDKLTKIDEDCYAMPYLHDQKEIKKVLKKVPEGASLFGHFELKSFDYGNGRICEDGLSTTPFKKFKHVISGHFHKYQKKGNFTYLGTPFSHSFGESNQVKALGLYHVSSGSLETLPTDFPRHITVEVDVDGSGSQEFDFKTDDYLRFILKGKQENINKFDKDAYAGLNVKFIERPTDTGLDEAQIQDDLTNSTQFEKFSEIQQWSPEVKKLGLEILGAVND